MLPMEVSFSSTQLPNAVGAAYSLKMDGKDACAVTFFGDGGSSEVKWKQKLEVLFSLLLSLFGWYQNNVFVFLVGRLPCCYELCSCYGSACFVYLQEQRMGD